MAQLKNLATLVFMACGLVIPGSVWSQQILFDFENGTAEGWASVLSDPSVPHVFTVTNALTNNGETLPTPASGSYQVLPIDFDDPISTVNTRDGAHTTLLMRSPKFILAPGEFRIAMVGGAEAGTLPTMPSDLASATNVADGLHVKGFGLRRVSDETYVLTGALSANTGGYQDVVFSSATIIPFVSNTEIYTLDVFDSFGGSWGWIGFDNVRFRGVLVGGPYSQDFESFADGVTDFADCSTLITNQPAAVGVIDHALQLTSDTITGTRTSFLMPSIVELSSGFRACFDYKLIDAPGEVINDLPADGFSFNIGAISPSSLGDEEGFGVGLSIEFDTHFGGGADIIGHNVAVNGTDVPGGANATDPHVDGQWHSVCIEWADGEVTVSVDEDVLFTDLATPGFTPVASNIFAFAARTGGATETVLIDNISITPPKKMIDTVVDENNGVTVGGVSLREAIASAQPNATITFDSSLNGQTIILSNGPLVIDQNLTIDGSALVDGFTIDANGASTNHRVLELTSSATIQLDSLTLTGGKTPDGGGASSDGGGVYIAAGVDLTLTNSTVSGNTTGSGGHGGGIYIASGGALSLSRSTISGNATGSGGHGGGIHNSSSEDLTLNTSTVSGNSTGNGGGGPSGSGGGISNMGGNLNLNLCTISDNATGDGGSFSGSGGGIHDDGGLVMYNTVITGNRTGINGFSSFGEGPDLWKDFGGIFFSGSGINFIGDLSDSGLSASSTLLTGDAMLATLGDYGGDTLTMMPLPGSPLIDPPGTDSFNALFPQDQRGNPRTVYLGMDIGAVEYSYDFAPIWLSDFDGDGRVYGLEYALGTDPNVSDAVHPANLTASTVTVGQVSLTFGYNCMASPRTNWVLTRSTDLTPGSFVEIYRYDGPNIMEILQPDIDSSITANSITVMDNDPPEGRAFYRLEAQQMPLLLSQIDSISFYNGIIDELWLIVPEVWVDSDDYSFQVEISGINAGYHPHGEDTIQMSDTMLLIADGGEALLSAPWTEDLFITHSPETYTACMSVFYKGEFTGYLNCTSFGPF